MSSGSELLEKIKNEYCDNCELSLRCLMGRKLDRPVFCSTCQGIVLEGGITVQCTCFIHIAMGLEQGFHAVPLRGVGIEVVTSCPACRKEEGAHLLEGFMEGRE